MVKILITMFIGWDMDMTERLSLIHIYAIASSVIGGTLLTGGVGNVIGTLFGVLIKGTIDTLVNTNGKLLSSWSSIAISALLCFFIVLQAVFALVKEKKKE